MQVVVIHRRYTCASASLRSAQTAYYFDTTASAGDADFLATLKTVEELKNTTRLGIGAVKQLGHLMWTQENGGRR